MTKIKLPTFTETSRKFVTVALSNRQLAFNIDDNTLYIKYNDILNSISANPDNTNIIKNSDNELSLNDDISLKSIQVSPDDNCVLYDKVLGENCITANKSILLLIEYSTTNICGLSGLIYRLGQNVCGSYHISIESNGDNIIEGATTDVEKAQVVLKVLNGKTYVGIQFNSSETSTLYFHGFDTRTSNPPSFNTYVDSDLTDVEENNE